LGTIFNDLLPGATAHLTLVDDMDVCKGAELRVHFNNVKKELS
jgi:chromosome segregation ATPase